MKKGFTLIELLAVIIILAVIALIATPVVLNVIETAKNKALVNSAYGIVDAAKLEYTESLLSGTVKKSGSAGELKVSGEKASAGTWEVTEAGTITITGVKFASDSSKTCATKSNSSEVECVAD